MEKTYDDTNWREEYKGYTNNKRYIELLENGPNSLSQAWLLGALHNEWKKMKGYDKLDPKENKGQCQSFVIIFARVLSESKRSRYLMHRFKEILPNKRKRKWWRIKLWSVTWSIVIMVAILLIAVTIVIYYIMRYDYLFPND